MTEPHWPADGSGDEADGGYDPTAYRIGTEELAKQIEDFLEPKGTEGPIYLLGKQAGLRLAAGVVRAAAHIWVGDHGVATGGNVPDDHPGDYESPHTAPFVQVRVNGELVPGHIVYPWPDGGLVVEPLEVAP